MERQEGFSFTKGLPVMKIQTDSKIRCIEEKDLFFDLEQDPKQLQPLHDEAVESRMIKAMKQLMEENEAPAEQYVRLGLSYENA